jgi:hypothetical protein
MAAGGCFHETRVDILAALARKPEDDHDDPSEAWKKSGHFLQLDAEKTGEEV